MGHRPKLGCETQEGETETYVTSTLTTHTGVSFQPYSRSFRHPVTDPTEDTEDCLDRTTVGLTRSKSLTILVSPLDMLGLMGMAQVVATIAYGIRGLRTGETTWSWPDFHSDPTQENLAQIQRW